VILLSGASGTGKSTILSALEYLLYGKLRKISSFEQTKTIVTLEYDGIAVKEFADGEGVHPDSITIMRRRDPSMLQLDCGDRIYKDDEAQAIIDKLFGTEDVFLASSYLKQGERSILLDGKNADKMLLVEQFAFNDDDISKYKDVLSEELKKSTRSLDIGTSTVKMLEGQVESYRVLNERALSLYAEEVDLKALKPVLTQVSLESELEELSLSHDQLWSRKNDLEVRDRSRTSILASNTDISQQILSLQTGLKVAFDTDAIATIETQVQDLQELVVSTQVQEEYITLKQQDTHSLTQFQGLYGIQCPSLPVVSVSIAERDIVFSEKEHLERQDRDNLVISMSNLTISAELESLPLSESSVDELVAEKETSSLLREYVTLRDKDTLRSSSFKQKYGEVAPAVPSPLENEDELRVEYAELQRLQGVHSKLVKLPPSRPMEVIEEDLTVATLLQQYAPVRHLVPITLPSTDYPLDLTQLSDLRDEEKQLLITLTGVFESVGTLDPSELQTQLEAEKQKLSLCGCKVECPQCNAELLYMDGSLKNAVVPKKSKLAPKLLPRLGARGTAPAPTSPTPSMAPMSPGIPIAYCTDPPEKIHQAIGKLQQNLEVLASLPLFRSLEESKRIIVEIDAFQVALTRQQNQARDLELKVRLERELMGRTTEPSLESLKQELYQSQEYQRLQAETKDFSLDRFEWVRDSITALTTKRKQHELVQAFELQREMEQEALDRRLEVLGKIYPDLEHPQLLLFDSQPFTLQYRDVGVINLELQQSKRRMECMTKLQTLHTVDTVRLKELRQRLLDIDQQRLELEKITKIIDLFVRQAEADEQALQRRLKVLVKLYPHLLPEELASIDQTNTVARPSRSSLQLKVELVALKAQLASMLKSREVLHRIDGLKASLQVVPESVVNDLSLIKTELVVVSKRQERLRQLRSSLSIQLQLQTIETQLLTQKGTVKDETKKYAVLDKLRLKALETETQALDSTIASINLEMAYQLERLFDTPITVRFETTKALKNGQSKYCINLAVNYRGVMYDDINQLSGGEAGRVSLAVTLALNKTASSPILMLDESLSTLDEELVDTVVDALKEVSQSYAIPIFVVMHNCTTGGFDYVVEF
jgi:DNA repair exonuclease SbcCD ATPase subunit